MALTPDIAVKNLETYLDEIGFQLEPNARSLVYAIENYGAQLSCELYSEMTLHTIIECSASLRSVMFRHGLDPDEALAVLERNRDDSCDPYGTDLDLYSDRGTRNGERARLVDFAIAAARRQRRRVIMG